MEFNQLDMLGLVIVSGGYANDEETIDELIENFYNIFQELNTDDWETTTAYMFKKVQFLTFLMGTKKLENNKQDAIKLIDTLRVLADEWEEKIKEYNLWKN